MVVFISHNTRPCYEVSVIDEMLNPTEDLATVKVVRRTAEPIQQIEHRTERAIMNPDDLAQKHVLQHGAIRFQPPPITTNSVDIQPALVRKLIIHSFARMY
ncbi:hypothetical protein BGZ90_006543 [Linnemannia elongata]|nr:hypothetical protein BGZ90_006543 [Linnemannia elongata]